MHMTVRSDGVLLHSIPSDLIFFKILVSIVNIAKIYILPI